MLNFYFLFFLNFLEIIFSACPNECNGRGTCDKYARYPFFPSKPLKITHFVFSSFSSLFSCSYSSRCTCSKGFQGADCSERICPYGTAWSDEAIGIDLAHSLSECSNRGICDRKHGRCDCMEGYTGAACERLKCQNDCNNFGICLTLEKIAENTR